MPLVKIKMKGPKPNSHTKITKISPPLPVTQNTQISQHVHQYFLYQQNYFPNTKKCQGQLPLSKKTYFKKNHANRKCTEIKLNQISSYRIQNQEYPR